MASSMTAAGAVDHLIGQMRKQQDPQMPPDCVGRYSCTKSSWRGRYRRIMCVTPNAVITQHPDNLAITNTYLFIGESDIDGISAAPVDQSAEEQEFTLSARSDKKARLLLMAGPEYSLTRANLTRRWHVSSAMEALRLCGKTEYITAGLLLLPQREVSQRGAAA